MARMRKNYQSDSDTRLKSENIIVGLDIGTTKVATVIGCMNPNGKIEVIGHGKTESRGVQFGMIQNVLKTSESIEASVNLAAKHAKIVLKDNEGVYAGIAARHIKSQPYKHYVLRENHEELISQEELDTLKSQVENIALPADQRIIDIIPQKYVIQDSMGGQHESADPVGETGSKVTGYYQVITGNITEINKINQCITRVNLSTEDLILEPIASGLACLSEEEKNRGVVLLDIGGGTTDLVIFENGNPIYSKVIPFGGTSITKDIAQTCRISEDAAEELKVKHGTCIPEKANANKVNTVFRMHDERPLKITDEQLAKIIYSRVSEILKFVEKAIQESGCKGKLQRVGAGLVITGGGANLRNLKELCQYILGLNTRIGTPGVGFSDSLSNDLRQTLYSTALGLLKYGFMENSDIVANTEEEEATIETKKEGSKSRKFELSNIKQLFNNIFEQIS